MKSKETIFNVPGLDEWVKNIHDWDEFESEIQDLADRFEVPFTLVLLAVLFGSTAGSMAIIERFAK